VKINYDESTDSMYIRFSNADCYESDPIKEGIILDYDKKGKVIAIEILEASKNLPAPKSSFLQINFGGVKAKTKASKGSR